MINEFTMCVLFVFLTLPLGAKNASIFNFEDVLLGIIA